MQHTFDTPDPITLFVELRSGRLVVHASDVRETLIEISGDHADDADVTQRGEEVNVTAKGGRGAFFGALSGDVTVHATVPLDSRVSAKLGSADVRTAGRLGETTLRSGSGDVHIEELGAAGIAETGSGAVSVGRVAGPLKVKCGSGDVRLDRVQGHTTVSTGSGSVVVQQADEPLAVRSGSGDVRIGEAHRDLSVDTASGSVVVDLIHRGELHARNVSGDIVVGVPAGVPVWTDVSSVSGRVRSDLRGAGEPAEGQDHLELRATTVSGDVFLEQR